VPVRDARKGSASRPQQSPRRITVWCWSPLVHASPVSNPDSLSGFPGAGMPESTSSSGRTPLEVFAPGPSPVPTRQPGPPRRQPLSHVARGADLRDGLSRPCRFVEVDLERQAGRTRRRRGGSRGLARIRGNNSSALPARFCAKLSLAEHRLNCRGLLWCATGGFIEPYSSAVAGALPFSTEMALRLTFGQPPPSTTPCRHNAWGREYASKEFMRGQLPRSTCELSVSASCEISLGISVHLTMHSAPRCKITQGRTICVG
jgi:hypothetical protein